MNKVLTLWAIFCLISVSSASAGRLDMLLMPGELIAGHAPFEQDCEQCHETLEKHSQADRCLACHDHADIKRDIENNQGFHGRLQADMRNQCRHCHTDHKGRRHQIVLLDTESFDHSQTDFELRDSHRQLACSSCHSQAEKKYREAPSNCYACHKADDAHNGKLGEECETCHNETDWQRQLFDHDLDTDYKLVGAHKTLTCKLCHADERYKNTPQECYACHLVNDVHNGHYAEQCDKCHTSESWKQLSFRHDVDTQYPLTGRHRQAACDTCHVEPPYQVKPKTSCNTCHRKDDEHKGRNGTDCKSCHSTQGWQAVDFDHAKDTEFPLEGRHEDLVCSACHRSTSMADIKSSECIDCHRANDVHKGGQGRDCASCHNAAGWNDKVFFDHGLTRFPLIGMHDVASCEACHLSAEYSNTETRCVACHAADDVHDKRFGEHCNSCHNPNGWMFWQFDHDQQTDYPLEGEHRQLHCNTCHRTALDQHNQLSHQCYGCHRTDDVHRGGFGRNCERCHNAESFKNPVIQ